MSTKQYEGLKLVIASGKGGTGKTTVAVNMAVALARSGQTSFPVVLLDCDVEEPNDHLFVGPQFDGSRPVDVLRPVWDASLCTACGKCTEACNYNAIALIKSKKKVLIFPELCHACGVCSFVCPESALTEHAVTIGAVEATNTNRVTGGDGPDEGFTFAHGRLNVGEPLAPAVVRMAKEHLSPQAINITDAAPGTACPVVEAVRDSDVALMVTEPTPFGRHDLSLAVSLALELRVPTCIVVNRSDGRDELIEDYAREVGVPIVGRIPFERKYAETYSRGELLIDAFPELSGQLLDIFKAAAALAGTSPPAVPAQPEAAPSTKRQTARASGPAVGRARECTIISGKGGTGKTTVAASLAALSSDKVLADCDVDAADLHLLLAPDVLEVHDFQGGIKAEIMANECTGCGKCEACHFEAIVCVDDGRVRAVDQFACEGCGLCALVCPVGAVHAEKSITGQSYVSTTSYGPMSHARLGVAEENSGKLVTRVRNAAAELVAQHGADKILGDGSPGTGCPVIASITGTDLVLVVTEPTVSGVHDLDRVLQLCRHFQVPAVVCINKSDLNDEQADRIRRKASETGAMVIGAVPFDPGVNDALMAGRTVVEYGDGPAAQAIRALWEKLAPELARV